MATDTTQTSTGFNFSPNAINPEDYRTVVAEREEMMKKQLAANNEFMYQHYARVLRALDTSYEKAGKANIVLERKTRRASAKQKRDALRAQKAKR